MLASTSRIIHRGHAEILGPMVQDIFRSTKTSARELSKISVCSGPGSFTGLRVGLSFAKGLALPTAIPVIGLSGLEVLAHTADPEKTHSVMAIADVRRGDVFWQRFEKGQAISTPVLSGIEPAKNELQQEDKIVGNGASLLGAAEQDGIVSPAVVAWLGLERSVSDYPAEPLYHRPPDAKLPGGRSL